MPPGKQRAEHPSLESSPLYTERYRSSRTTYQDFVLNKWKQNHQTNFFFFKLMPLIYLKLSLRVQWFVYVSLRGSCVKGFVLRVVLLAGHRAFQRCDVTGTWHGLFKGECGKTAYSSSFLFPGFSVSPLFWSLLQPHEYSVLTRDP